MWKWNGLWKHSVENLALGGGCRRCVKVLPGREAKPTAGLSGILQIQLTLGPSHLWRNLNWTDQWKIGKQMDPEEDSGVGSVDPGGGGGSRVSRRPLRYSAPCLCFSVTTQSVESLGTIPTIDYGKFICQTVCKEKIFVILTCTHFVYLVYSEQGYAQWTA